MPRAGAAGQPQGSVNGDSGAMRPQARCGLRAAGRRLRRQGGVVPPRDHRTAGPRGIAAGVTVGVRVGVAGFMTGALLLFPLTGCGGARSGAGGSGTGGSGPGGSGPGGSGPGSSQTQSVQQQSQTIWLRFARCARSHGAPDFPDPNVNSRGYASFADPGQVKQETVRVQGTCGVILSQLPPSARNSPVTAAQLRQLKAFARCLRSPGMPAGPDPKPDGTFPIVGTPLAAGGKTQALINAEQACRQVYSGGLSASSAARGGRAGGGSRRAGWWLGGLATAPPPGGSPSRPPPC